MKEQLYTIPVNDAFNEPCECPPCFSERNTRSIRIAHFPP